MTDSRVSTRSTNEVSPAPTAMQAADAPEGRAKWSTLAQTGLVLTAVGALLPLVVSLLWGLDLDAFVMFFVVPAALALLGAALLRRGGTWPKVVGIVAAAVAVLALWWTFFGLFEPASIFDFVPGVLVLPGALLAIGSCIAAIRASRRGRTAEQVGPRERGVIRAVVGAAGALTVLSGILTITGRTTVDDPNAADVTVRMTSFEFDQDDYALSAGSLVLVRNDDPFFHTFTIDALDIDVALNPGSEKLVQLPQESGSFVLHCEPHTENPEDPSGDDMAATLRLD